MLTQAVDDYLAVRRAAGFKLKTTEQYLRYFVRFADAHGDTHVRAKSAIAALSKPYPTAPSAEPRS